MRSPLRSRTRDSWPAESGENNEDDGRYEDDEEDRELTAQTAAMLRVAPEELSEHA
ncbi:hypothetical protein [Streptomyces sp. RP5T]|uniref:hypothetical protein n=1 Tax=Streptomyces sp. RP5T TaxID=2490848 RepID=UPI00163B04DC|nr:hypothetical protein [Streptomyces sp. RP5T]